ncbi:hypothetical protein N8T08_005849 [Aspergillus melleus]|uniref:Uncharacterized protein n=1 Tax=Aspergillus melleus TaxID=138277 RepID=A0ACC3B1A0_9EURO|nr:hypothetical protein N8T08_005849 [Aspergillus melleus]
MLFIKASTLTLGLFSGLSSAHYSIQPSSTDGLQLIDDQRLPDRRCASDPDDNEAFTLPLALELAEETGTNTTTELVTEAFEGAPSQLSQFASILTGAYTGTASVAAAIWNRSHQKDCSYHAGNIDGWRYEYHATDRNCEATAQKKIIEGAIRHYLNTVEDNKACGTQCLTLDTNAGYVKLGKEGVFDSSAYCGPSLNSEGCASGL